VTGATSSEAVSAQLSIACPSRRQLADFAVRFQAEHPEAVELAA
jgi:hypothetical protein